MSDMNADLRVGLMDNEASALQSLQSPISRFDRPAIPACVGRTDGHMTTATALA